MQMNKDPTFPQLFVSSPNINWILVLVSVPRYCDQTNMKEVDKLQTN